MSDCLFLRPAALGKWCSSIDWHAIRGSTLKQFVENRLSKADITINGDRPWDLQVRNPSLFGRLVSEGCLGLGESYMDGWWDCESVDEFCCRAIRAGAKDSIRSFGGPLNMMRPWLFNLQTIQRAFRNGQHHYDIGNHLYRRMLDRRMIYSCAYWKNADDLDRAQEAKLDLVCRKLMLEPGMKVLDIGCGWGGALKFAVEEYGVQGVGITVSQAQAEYARQTCDGLPIEIRLCDYRQMSGTFDRVMSIGMMEHVGYKNYRAYFRNVRELLREDGLFLLHTIGGNTTTTLTDPWIDKYIFPNSMLPSGRQLCQASEGLFVIEDWHNFGYDYDPTLMSWFKNFDAAWDELRRDYDERFYRMWKFYLLSCAGLFRARRKQVWQLLLSPRGVPSGCPAARSC